MKHLYAVAALLLTTSSAFAAPVTATAPAGGANKYDTKQPIEISSATLEVQQQKNQAIFKGNVIAVQGNIRLKSDVMIVHYTPKDQQKAKPAPSKAAKTSESADGAMGAISLIEVEGNVQIATPEESAIGDRGNYDVNAHLIHLFGDNVTLTREKNILKGTALEYNLETGRSLLSNNGTAVDGKNGRVRGLFVPNQDGKK